jgi:hypothetical protein
MHREEPGRRRREGDELRPGADGETGGDRLPPPLMAEKPAVQLPLLTAGAGGGGTTTLAARAGAPQLVIPQVLDQPYWARRVADLGIGTAHDGPNATTESLSAALKVTLNAETRARTTVLADNIRTDGATVAATLLLDAAFRRRPPERQVGMR